MADTTSGSDENFLNVKFLGTCVTNSVKIQPLNKSVCDVNQLLL